MKEWSKDVEKNAENVDRAVDNITGSFKDAIRQQKEFIKGIEKEIDELEKAFDKMSPGKESQAALKEINHAKKVLAEGQADLMRLQEEQIALNNKEAESAYTLSGMIKKWALGLGGAAAALAVLKKAFGETTAGMNALNIVGAVTNQILYDIVSGAGMSMTKLKAAVDLQREYNALRLEGYVNTFQSAKLMNEYQQLYADAIDQTLNRAERLKLIDEALEIHNKAIDIQVKDVKKNLELVEKDLLNKPGSDKLKKQYADLMTELENLDARRVSSTKRLLSLRSGLIKEQTEEEKKYWEDLHDDLMKLADEHLARQEEYAEKLKATLNEVEALRVTGKDRELLQLKQKYEADLELYKDNEQIKAALTEKYALARYEIEMKYLDQLKKANEKLAEDFRKLVPQSGYSMLNKFLKDKGKDPLSFGFQTDSDKLVPFDMKTHEKNKKEQDKKNKAEEEALQRQFELRVKIANEAANLIYQLGRQIGLEDKALEQLSSMLDTMTSLASGDLIGTVTSLLSTVIASFPEAAEKYANQIERLNGLLDEQARIIEQSQRKGGEREALEQKVDLLNQKYLAKQKELEKAQKKLDNSLGGIFFMKRYKDVEDLKQDLIDIGYEAEEAQQAVDDFLTGGITENTIADIIAQGFQEGKTSVDDFANYMNDVLIQAVLSIFKGEILGPAINDYMDWLREAMEGGLSEEEKEESARRLKAIADSSQELWETWTSGFDFGEGPLKPLSGQIARAITEDTASELTGLVRRGIDDTRQIKDYAKIGIDNLIKIEADNTEIICKKLDQVIDNTKPPFSGEM